MKLGNVLSGCEYELAPNLAHDVLDTDIAGISDDSRKVTKNGMFVAVKGEGLDGHDFIEDAVRKGAAAVVTERVCLLPHHSRKDVRGIPVLVHVHDSRRTLSCAANNFYERPSEHIAVTGITGTNGKTTTSYLVKSILEAWHRKTGLIGTITYLIGDRQYPALHTTPGPLEFQGLLRQMVSEGCSHAVSEVSSHALSQGRVDHTRFAVVVFTNLTRDHLDFHGTMENYFTAKERLFVELLGDAGAAVINVDDEWGRKLLEGLRSAHKRGKRVPAILTYGTTAHADVSASRRKDSLGGLSFEMRHGEGTYRVESSLIGLPNVYNILAAVSVGIAFGIPMEVILEGIRGAAVVRGRLEQVDAGQDFLCIVDYAHTPDALERLILTARELLHNKDGPGRVITLFGCGGDRDRGKRPVMGEIATRLSDQVIITSDNPRSEDPVGIIKEIETGTARQNYTIILDRGEAIRAAVKEAGRGDILLIAGKGHEEYQERAGIRGEFSDRKVAEAAIRSRMAGTRKN